MPKGTPVPPETVVEVMALWALHKNCAKVARELNMSASSVEKIVRKRKSDPEYKAVQEKVKKIICKRAEEIMVKVLDRIDEQVSDPDAKLPLNHLATTYGILCDKHAVATGKPTVNVSIVGNDTTDKLAAIAGYVKKK